MDRDAMVRLFKAHPRRAAVFGLSALMAGVIGSSAAVSASTGPSSMTEGSDFVGSSTAVPVPRDGSGPNRQAARSSLSYVTGRNDFTGGHVVVEGRRLYVGSYGLGMRWFDISDPANPRLLGRYTPGGRADAVPDAMRYAGREFAVLNGTGRITGNGSIRTDRSEFLDVTDPRKPVLLHTFVGPTDGEAHNGDMVDNRRLWLPSGGRGLNGLRIFDLSPLLRTDRRACRPSGGAANPCGPRKIFGSKAKTGEGDPVKLWKASPYRRGRSVGAAFTHTHDITVYTDYPVAGRGRRDIALLAEGGEYGDDDGNTGSVFVIDITDPRRPVVLLRWLHERGRGHDSIRYYHEAQFLDGDRRVMLVADEDLQTGCGGAGGVTAARLSGDLSAAKELSEWSIPSGTLAPLCSVHVFSSKRKHVFLGSYNAGLQVVDYRDPANPRQIAAGLQPGNTSWGALYHAGYVYVGDLTRGLDVYRVRW